MYIVLTYKAGKESAERGENRVELLFGDIGGQVLDIHTGLLVEVGSNVRDDALHWLSLKLSLVQKLRCGDH